MPGKKQKRFLITGGCGFIGSSLVRNLSKNENFIIGNIDKLTYSSNLNSLKDISNKNNYTFFQEDICNKDSIQEIIFSFKPNYIVHLAAETHVDRSIDGPEIFLNSNILGTYNLLNSFKNYYDKINDKNKDASKFLLVSTDEVYGSLYSKQDQFTENSPYLPNSPYSASKASADHLARAWNSTYNLPILITNTSNNYGPWQFPEKLIPLTISKCLKKERIPIFGNGQQIRDWIFVNDHVDGILSVLESGVIGEKYNIGSNNEKMNIEVVQDICGILDKKIPYKNSYSNLIEFVDDRPGHDFRYALNSEKIKKIGWKPKYNWSNGLNETIDWYINNQDYLNRDSSMFYSGERLGSIK
tara:strand:+ start:3038 stop:4105 length:1068 start_codon:yes stop_codon:yes gene_type:complete